MAQAASAQAVGRVLGKHMPTVKHLLSVRQAQNGQVVVETVIPPQHDNATTRSGLRVQIRHALNVAGYLFQQRNGRVYVIGKRELR